ncbi:hypothetical protein C2E23DRAFT_402359 [Lenzites betulinus]|nr:hypothetical protein C2E23DRAFT_402359 [Lenzites betulinus]
MVPLGGQLYPCLSLSGACLAMYAKRSITRLGPGGSCPPDIDIMCVVCLSLPVESTFASGSWRGAVRFVIVTRLGEELAGDRIQLVMRVYRPRFVNEHTPTALQSRDVHMGA